jgi:hypothetical protein
MSLADRICYTLGQRLDAEDKERRAIVQFRALCRRILSASEGKGPEARNHALDRIKWLERKTGRIAPPPDSDS